MKTITQCWCGNGNLLEYSVAYARCGKCNTLVLKEWPFDDPTHVNDEGEFYGKDYYLKIVPETYGLPSLYERARLDLTGRVPYWLRTLIKYRLPPASALELGSAHGGFVAFLRAAGFQAVGLELSPWLVQFAQEIFGVSIRQGPIESQDIPQSSLDIIAHMDVLEHLPDPVGTMRVALELLKSDGIMILQTPCYDPAISYEQLVQTNHPFQFLFRERGHLYLFSQQSLETLFHNLGWDYIQFEPAIFSQYDMFAIISRRPLRLIPTEERVAALQASPSGRMILALLDLYDRAEDLQHHADARLKIVQEQSAELEILRKAAQERLEVIQQLDAALKNKPES